MSDATYNLLYLFSHPCIHTKHLVYTSSLEFSYDDGCQDANTFKLLSCFLLGKFHVDIVQPAFYFCFVLSDKVLQAGLDSLRILLPQPPECKDYRHVLPRLVSQYFEPDFVFVLFHKQRK